MRAVHDGLRERLYAHFLAVRHVVEHNIEGDIVECGVWRGGTSMLGALTLLGLNDLSLTPVAL